jgi:hypothetical protein
VNTQAPFTASDLEEIDARLYSVADRVVPMLDIANGDIGRNVIGLRHDVDDNAGSFDTALRMAEWEAERGYRSTWFLLHDSHYWPQALEQAARFKELGHEVGLHVNAIAEALRQRRDPAGVVAEALDDLRSVVTVKGVVAHGDGLCYRPDGTLRFVNDELFRESPRPSVGEPGRVVAGDDGWWFQLKPVSRANLGIRYDANWLPRSDYLSDSGGQWSQPFDTVASRFGHGQLHVLIHPDWWSDAFVGVRV